MAVRKINVSSGSLFITLLIAGFILLWLPQSFTCHLNFLFVRVFDPLLRLGRHVEIEAAQSRPAAQDTIRQAEYNKLWKAYENLHAQYRALHQEYETLAMFRKDLPRPWPGLVLTQITSTTRGIRHELILNKGSDHGIRPGQVVITEAHDSIIGVVQEVSAQLSRVRLLTDPSQDLKVLIRRHGRDTEYVGRLVGDGKNACHIPLLSRDYDIREGDVVYAAPKPGILEIPLVIGEVTQVRPDDQHPLLWDIIVKPIDDPYSQTVVAVIVPADFKTETQEQER